MAFRPRLGTVLLLMNLVVLLLPLSGIWILRLYESALIRQTESELIAQGAVIAAAYRSAWHAAGGSDAELGPAPPPRTDAETEQLGQWRPRFATLDLAEEPILPVPPEDEPPAEPAAPAVRRAGEQILPILLETQRTTLAGIRIVDRHAVVVATTRSGLGHSMLAQEEVVRALAGEAVSVLRQRVPDFKPTALDSISRGAELRVFTALPILEEDRVLGAVVLSRTPRTLAQALYGKRWHLFGLALLLVGSVAALATLAALSVVRPLRRITDQAKLVAAGGEAVLPALPRPAIREAAELSDALDRMARTIAQRADYIRIFAAQVSHEFKTPLASIRGTVELLRDHLETMSREERDRFLANLDGDAGRLDRLVRRLLDLARADVLRPSQAEGTDLGGSIGPIAERYRGFGLRVETHVDPGIVAAIGADALDTVLGNLLDNVRQHAGLRAAASVTARRQGGEVVITVSDDGPGISAGNAARVFDRFFTTARSSGGTGLGLSIVQSVIAAHRGTVALLPSAAGTSFEIRLPALELGATSQSPPPQ